MKKVKAWQHVIVQFELRYIVPEQNREQQISRSRDVSPEFIWIAFLTGN